MEPGDDRAGLGQRGAGDGAGGRDHRHGAGAGHPPHQLEVPFHHRQCAEKDGRHPARHPQHLVCHPADITHRIAAGRGCGGLPDRIRLQPAAHRGHRVYQRNAGRYPQHHLRLGGYAGVQSGAGLPDLSFVRQSDAGGDEPAHHHPHHTGIPENGAAGLPRGCYGSGCGQMAHHPHHCAALQH